MKKAKLNSKLNLKKEQIANLNEVKGGGSTWEAGCTGTTWADTCSDKVCPPTLDCTKDC